MNQYNVIKKDKTSELVEAYDWHWSGDDVIFDLGHKQTKTVKGVVMVEVLP